MILENFTKNFENLAIIDEVAQKLGQLYLEGDNCNAIPLLAWTGNEDSRKFMFPVFKTIGT
jgi:hypothetical protein